MKNTEIASILREIAATYIIKNEKKYYFQTIAYQRAADTIENSTSEVKDLLLEGKLDELPGIGPTILGYLTELINTGKVKHFEEIKKEIPRAVFPLIKISGIGPKTAFKLVMEFRLQNPDTAISDLKIIAENGEIAKLEGFGEKSQQHIIQSIAEFNKGKSKSNRMLLPFAMEIAQKVMDYMMKCPEVIRIDCLGSLRRLLSTVGDIDLAVASRNPKKVIEWFTKYPYQERLIEAGPSTSSFLTSGGKQVDLMVSPPECFGALLQHFTGSKAHNIHLRTYAQSRGMSLSEKGIKLIKQLKSSYFTPNNFDKKLKLYQFASEKMFYDAIGLQWIPPEMREDSGEIELAIQNKLPGLIELSDIKGDLHTHSSFDIEPSHDLGRDGIEEMRKKAERMNYEYLGLSEHNPSQSNHSNIEFYKIIEARNKLIEQLNKSTKSVHLFKLLEVDITHDGKLAIDDKSADLLDGMIVSVHSSFKLDKNLMTKRIIKGLSHKKARILGHPTGRLINQRAGYEADWNEIFTFCKQNNKAIEISAWPTRLDPPDFLIREAVKIGVKMVINTDSHAKDQMEVMKFGVMQARRGWVMKENVLNTLPFQKLLSWLFDV